MSNEAMLYKPYGFAIVYEKLLKNDLIWHIAIKKKNKNKKVFHLLVSFALYHVIASTDHSVSHSAMSKGSPSRIAPLLIDVVYAAAIGDRPVWINVDFHQCI